MAEGWHGWDDYAAFYDWENARTVGRRDVAFWRDFALRAGGHVLELGCGTGRVAVPLARAGVPVVVGVDRSAEMLAFARRRLRRARLHGCLSLVRADIRQLPFRRRAPFDIALAPYGVLQSLLKDRDLVATLEAVAATLRKGGRLGVDLVPDVPRWREYTRRVTLAGRRGPGGRPIRLIESVRHDRARRLTVFEHEYVEGTGRARRSRTFTVTFRTLSVPAMCRRIERAGFRIDAVLGDYDGGPWDARADTWVVLATRI